jgi:CTP synthase (UTP-ammonia lyase)
MMACVTLQTTIAIVGDHDPERESHRATDEALQHAAAALGLAVSSDWIPTGALEGDAGGAALERYDAVFLGPGAPYRSTEGAFAASRFAREQGGPFFGT